MQDEFEHDQCLVISENGRSVLICGCAHNGILNILDRYHELFEGDPSYVLSGFHMMKKTNYTEEEKTTICEIVKELAETDTIYFSGHCTGEPAFVMMKEIMGEKLCRIRSGEVLVEE